MSGGPIFTQTSTPRERPLSVLEVISRVQQYAAVERLGIDIPSTALQSKDWALCVATGLKGGAGGLAVNLILLPFGVGVINRQIPAFGGAADQPWLAHLDALWAVILSLSWSISYLVAISLILSNAYIGATAVRMIGWLYQGYLAGTVLKCGLGLVLYGWLSHAMTPMAVAGFVANGWAWLAILISPRVLSAGVDWYHGFYPLWPQISGWLVVTSAALVLLPPLIFRHARRQLERERAWNRLYDQF